MARYKSYDLGQTTLVAVSFERQVLPGSFEYALSEVIDRHVDLSVFAARYNNDATGAPAYDPALLLKVILYAYSRGVTSSREIARLCREHIVFMALSGDSQPHFTTIAGFIATLGSEIESVFRDVLLICDEAGLIGRELFAVDGVKLPSNASKGWSGTRADYARKVEKMQTAVRYLTARHRASDAAAEESTVRAARAKQLRTLRAAIAKVQGFLATTPDKVGSGGRAKKSNLIDNDSAKMATAHGVLQGYDGLAVVDGKHQVVVHASAHGEGQEHGLLVPALEATRARFRALGQRGDVLRQATVLADAGFHSEPNLRYLEEHGIGGYLADTRLRKRDPRFATAARHVPTAPDAPWSRPAAAGLFQPRDFQLAADRSHCVCPAGRRLYRSGAHCRIGGRTAMKFKGTKRDCAGCPLRARCLRHPGRTVFRQVAFFGDALPGGAETASARMRRAIDSEQGRNRYARRLQIVEPVFANIRCRHRLDRFTLRGRRKVDAQWKLYCLVHNIGKLQRYGGLG